MRKRLTLLLLLLSFCWVNAQEDRIRAIQNNLEVLAIDNPAFNETLKLEVNVSNVTLPNFLMAVSKVHQLNLSVASDISTITIVNNFSNVTVADLLVFLCKEYSLTIDFTGSILSIKRYTPPMEKPVEKAITIDYQPGNEFIAMDVDNDPLEKVFRKIMEASGKNLLYSNALRSKPLTLFLNAIPFDDAMEKLAQTNGLGYSKSRDGFYLFSALESDPTNRQRMGGLQPGMRYEVLDTINKLLNVDFNNAAIADVIAQLSTDLKLDIYTATPLEEAGTVTFTTKGIYFDDLLTHIFESQENGVTPTPSESLQNTPGRTRPNTNTGATNAIPGTKNFTFKKENNIYFF